MITLRRMTGAEYVARMGEEVEKIAYWILEGKPRGKRQIGRHRCMWRRTLKWMG
jgi:hypothetical protein